MESQYVFLNVQCGSKKSRYVKEQEARRLMLGPNSPLTKFLHWLLSFKNIK